MKKIFLFLLLPITQCLYGQNSSISAKVYNDKNQTLDGNAILTDTNSNFISSSYFENGTVSMSTELQGVALVKVCVLGYEDFQKRIKLSGTQVDLNSFIIQSKVKE